MKDDTISNDPRMMEEARRVAAESNRPKPPKLTYDARVIAKEEHDRIVNKTIVSQTFEEDFKSFDDNQHGDSVFSLDEAEYRQFVQSMWHYRNALALAAESKKQHEQADALKKVAIFSLNARMGQDTTTKYGENNIVDLTSGYVRKRLEGVASKCPMHPMGCPEEDLPPGVHVIDMSGPDMSMTTGPLGEPHSGNPLEMLMKMLSSRMKK